MNLEKQIQSMIYKVYFSRQMETVMAIILEIFLNASNWSRGQT